MKNRRVSVWFSTWPWAHQMVLVLVGYAMAGLLGTALVAPTGPGSSRICYLVLLGYSLVVVLFGARLMKVFAGILAIVFVIGIVSETKARESYLVKMIERERTEFMKRRATQPSKEISISTNVVSNSLTRAASVAPGN